MRNKWTFGFTVGSLLALLNLAGCYEPVNFPEVVSPPKPAVTIAPAYYRIVGTSVQGFPLVC